MNTIKAAIETYMSENAVRRAAPHVASVIKKIRSGDPRIPLRPAPRAKREVDSFARIKRGEIVYYVNSSYRILNPFTPTGEGVSFVLSKECDPVGAFFTERITASEEEAEEAVRAYIFAVGVPRDELTVLPAFMFRRAYERTPRNIKALEDAGALLFHEDCGGDLDDDR